MVLKACSIIYAHMVANASHLPQIMDKDAPAQAHVSSSSCSAHSIRTFPSLRECGRPLGGKDSLSRSLGNAVGEGKLKILRKELLNVRTSDKVTLLNFDNFQDLLGVSRLVTRHPSEKVALRGSTGI